MPSIPFFLIILSIFSITPIAEIDVSVKAQKIIGYIYNSVNMLGGCFLLLLFIFSFYFKLPPVTYSIFLIPLIFFFRKNVLLNLSVFFVLMAFSWNIVMPSFFLPLIPEKTISIIGPAPVAVVMSKPYFVENALNKTVTVLDGSNIEDFIDQHSNDYFYITPETIYNEQQLGKKTILVGRWNVWKRNNRLPNFYHAILSSNIDSLQESIFLFKKNSAIP